jgi:hypothetical protein
MRTPSISFDTVREIMTSWMTQYTEDWDNEGSRWNYESDEGIFEWYKYNYCQCQGYSISIGARLANEGSTIIIWTDEQNNDNIIINDSGLVLNEHSSFYQHFDHGKMYDLFMKLKYRDNGEEAEKITNECLEKESKYTGIDINQIPGIKVKQKFDLGYFELYKAYAVYDQVGECKHAILRDATENSLEFIYYYAGPTHISVNIDDYLNKKFKIKPLVVDEQ